MSRNVARFEAEAVGKRPQIGNGNGGECGRS